MATTTQTVFITVPKYMALQKIRPAPSADILVKSVPILSETMSCNEESNDGAPKSKKRRLDHLTWEEKIQRKKLKNRVAAQTSRDRKKARMEEMEFEIKTLTEKTEILQNKCASLQNINDALLAKNTKLDLEVENLKRQLSELQKLHAEQKQITADDSSKEVVKRSGCDSILTGSAVSNGTDPLQQGSLIQMVSQTKQKQLKENNTMAALWRIIALCLLYKTCSSSMKNSMPESLKSWPRVYLPISQQIWKEAIERSMKLLPKLQAKQSDSLDQWWGPKQKAWNPANITTKSPEIIA